MTVNRHWISNGAIASGTEVQSSMYLIRETLKTAAHVSSQKSLVQAALPGTVSKHINPSILEGPETLDDEEVLIWLQCLAQQGSILQ